MRRLILAICISSVLCFVACGGGGNNGGGISAGSTSGGTTPQATVTSVTVTCNPNSLQYTLTSACSVTVTGTGSFWQTVIWKASTGSIDPTGSYTAPTVTATTQATITATSTYDATKSGTATITINPPSTITYIQVSCSPNAITTGQQSQCSAVVNGPTAENQSVTWSVSFDVPDGPSCNCISSSGVVTGPQVPGFRSLYAQATSLADPTKSAWYVIDVGSPGAISSVTPTCTKTALNPGQDTLCTAVVTGTGGYSSAVSWSTTPQDLGGMFPSGLYVVDKYNTNYVVTVTAAAVQDPSKAGNFTITVTPPTTPTNNVAPLVVDGGPTGSGNVNTSFTTVTVCVPGTSNCQTIDHVLVDTGSVGLRLLSAGAAGGQLNLSLPPVIGLVNQAPLSECAPFVSGFLWGPLVQADVLTLPDGTGEQASNIPIQVVGQPGQPSPPVACSSSGVDLGTLHALGANGILGIGVFAADCGIWCGRLLGSSLHLLFLQLDGLYRCIRVRKRTNSQPGLLFFC